MEGCLVLCRLVHYTSALALFGTSIYQAWLAPKPLRAVLDRAEGSSAIVLAAAALVSALVWLGLAAGETGEGWPDVVDAETLKTVLFATDFGHVWQWHIGLGLAVLSVVILLQTRWRLTSAIAGLFLGSLGFVGHAVMHEGLQGGVSRLSHVAHLLAAGFWLGSLLPLVRTLALLQNEALRQHAIRALKRFSGLGHVAVAAVVLTGIVNTDLVLGTVPIPPVSPYRALLLAKVTVVGAMVALAVLNRYIIVPRMSSNPRAWRLLRTATLSEALLGLSAVALVSVLGTLSPD